MKLLHSNLDRRKFLWMSAFALASPTLINFRGVTRAMGRTQEITSKPIIRGVYTEAEKKLLADTNKWIQENKKTGWITSVNNVVTAEAVKNRGLSRDPWNPLWSNDAYAAKTRWGGIVPFPCFEQIFGSPAVTWIVNLECGHGSYTKYGEEFEWFKPIRVGDKIRTWAKGDNIKIKDTTPLDGNGPRKFEHLSSDVERINQNDELVATEKKWNGREFYPEPPNPPYIPDYGYTEEELKYLYDTLRQEEIRGARIRYWEDVNIGDELNPTVYGPTSILDVFSSGGDMGAGTSSGPRVPPGPVEERTRPIVGSMGYHSHVIGPWEFVADAETGLLYTAGFTHYDDHTARASGSSRPFLFGVQGRDELVRLITNWMGDDGFIRRFKWMHVARTIIGDAWIGHGKVVDKRVDNGEYLVDLKVWLEDIRGFTPEVAVATVRLVSSKESYFTWK